MSLRKTVASLALLAALPLLAQNRTRNVIFVMTDGLRHQEVFDGAQDWLITVKNTGSLTEVERLQDQFLRDTPQARREALLPFFWGTVAKKGQVYGNKAEGSESYVTNGRNFSYPGYSEIFCGFPDERINSNAKVPNANVTVLEWLHRKPEFKGKIGAFTAWDVFPYILNTERAGFPVISAHAPFPEMSGNPQVALLNEIKAELPEYWPSESFDAVAFHTALEYLKEKKPRVLFISLGETDSWGHAGNYKHYLRAAARFDRYVQRLWEVTQSMPEYKDSTAFILGSDHGRGNDAESWKSHGEKIPDSKWNWMAYMGPDTPALGERKNVPAVTQSQVAATLAALLGQDYVADVPKAGKPIADVVPKGR